MTTGIKISTTALISGILSALNFTFNMFKYLLITIQNFNTRQTKLMCSSSRRNNPKTAVFWRTYSIVRIELKKLFFLLLCQILIDNNKNTRDNLLRLNWFYNTFAKIYAI